LYNRPEVAAVPSGLSPTPLIIIIIIIIIIIGQGPNWGCNAKGKKSSEMGRMWWEMVVA
jgi:hypothetical protein